MALSDFSVLKAEKVVSTRVLAADELRYVQSSVALPFWSREEDGGGVK